MRILFSLVFPAALVVLSCDGPSSLVSPSRGGDPRAERLRPGGAARAPTMRPVAGELDAAPIDAPDIDWSAARASLGALGDAAASRLDASAVRQFDVHVTTAVGSIRTNIEVAVVNAQERPRELVLRLPIPAGAAVEHADLHVGDRVMRGAFIGTGRAGAVYGEITRIREDPLLVRFAGPGWLDISLFPVPAGETRRFAVSWVEPRAVGQRWYRAPVLADRGRVLVRPRRTRIDGVALERNARTWLKLPAPADDTALVVAQPSEGEVGYAMARTGDAPARAAAAVVVLDTSAATNFMDWQQRLRAAQELLTALGDARVTVLAADWLVQPIATDMPARAAGRRLARWSDVPRAGTLDMTQVLEHALREARALRSSAIIYLGSGRGPFSGTMTAESLARLQALQVSLSVVHRAPTRALAQLAWSSGGHLATGSPASLQRLTSVYPAPPVSDVVPAERWYPLESADGELVWLARVQGASPEMAVRGGFLELQKLWTRARIVAVSEAAADLGIAHGVVTPWTAVLALDSPEAYRQWGLSSDEPTQLAWGRPGVTARVEPEIEQAASTFAALGDIRSDAADTRAPSQARASTRKRQRRRRRQQRQRQRPSMVVAAPTATEGLPPRLLVRVLENNWYRLAPCYERALRSDRRLAGTLTVRFGVTGSGQVVGAVATGLENRRLQRCVARNLRQVRFPKPRTCGMMVARVPLHLHPRAQPGQSPAHPHLSAWRAALAALDANLPLAQRLADIARLLDAPARDWTPAALAWHLVEQRLRRQIEPALAYRLVATLLHDSGHARDAERVLSEGVHALPLELPSLMRRRLYAHSATRMTALLRR